MQLISSPFICYHSRSFCNVLPNFRGKNCLAAIGHRFDDGKIRLPFNATPKPFFRNLRLIHLNNPRELCRTSLDVQFALRATEDASEPLRGSFAYLRLFCARSNADRKFVEVTHCSYTIHTNFVPLEWRRTLIREHMPTCPAAVLSKTILEFSMLPTIDASATRTAEASFPAF